MLRNIRTERAQSTTIAVALLFGLTAIASLGILMIGGQAISEFQSESELEDAEQSLIHVNHQLSTVSADGASASELSVELADDVLVDESEGTITVSLEDELGNTDTLLDEQPMGAIRYPHGDREIAVQGGGVWRDEGDAMRPLTAPAITFETVGENETLVDMAIPSIQGAGSLGSDSVAAHEETRLETPDDDVLDGETNMTITVQSTYYEGWARYFATQGFGTIELDHDTSTVSIELPGPVIEDPFATDRKPLDEAFFSAGATSIGQNTTLDSYNSSDGRYQFSQDENAIGVIDDTVSAGQTFEIGGDLIVRNEYDRGGHGGDGATVTGDLIVHSDETTTLPAQDDYEGTVSTHGTLEAQGRFRDDVIGGAVDLDDATVHGDVHAEGDVTLSGNTMIHGDVVAGGSITKDPTVTVHGETAENDDEYREPLSVDLNEPSPIDSEIDSAGDDFADENDNENTTLIDDAGEFDCNAAAPSSTCELTAGQYYVDELTLSGIDQVDTLVLDSSDGPIELYADDGIELHQDAEIAVEGFFGVELYSNGPVTVGQEATVSTPDQLSGLLWLYGHSTADVNLRQDSTFEGVIYGPGIDDNGGEIDLRQESEVFGAIVGNVHNVGQEAEIHYDEALKDGMLPEPELDGEDSDASVEAVTVGVDVVIVDPE